MTDKELDNKTRFQPKRPKGESRQKQAKPAPDESTVFRHQRHLAGARGDQTRFVPGQKSKTRVAPQSDRTVVKPSIKPSAKPESRPTAAKPDQTRMVKPAASAGSRNGANLDRSAPRKPDSAESAPYGVLKNRFELLEVLGSGGMGVVYKARDRLKIEAQDRDPYVAIKVLNEEFKSHPEAFIALQRESRKSQRIAHPNIVTVYDFDRDGDTVLMTMEFLDGKPLDKLLGQYRNTGLPWEDLNKTLEGICSALIYAHAENIIHSDLKPGNIFVTNRGTTKVFDFGIARAVAKAERSDSHDDKTVFDAGNLGALTPAYASLEMLEGAPPDTRDDIYALGCIAYEMLAGEHPFNRMHADEARRQKLKPKRIPGIPTHQWRAIEHCLAFERENRIASVEAFWQQFSHKHRSKAKYFLTAAIVLSSLATAAYQYREEYLPQFSEQDVRSEIEQQLRLELKKESIDQLIDEAAFTVAWENDLWADYQEVRGLLNAHDPWLATQTSRIYQLYLTTIPKKIEEKAFTRTETLLKNASRYSGDEGRLAALEKKLAAAIEAHKLEQKRAEAAQREAEAVARQRQEEQAERQRVDRAYQAALTNVEEQLACRQQLNMEDLKIAVERLRHLNPGRYQQQEPRITRQLAQCIETVGRTFPERAEVFKQQALLIFPGNTRLGTVAIEPRDACRASMAGAGAGGSRAGCQDRIPGGGKGPQLVVVPGIGNAKPYAIGKHEIRRRDYQRFCQESDSCTSAGGQDDALPLVNVGIGQVEAYLQWLSEATGHQYRLPTELEWRHAARAEAGQLDSNRNCRFDSRGIRRGGSLGRASVGKQNAWGLVNHVGNASEWVRGSGGTLYSLGGNYQTPMNECNLSTKNVSSGAADPLIGFRVLRKVTAD